MSATIPLHGSASPEPRSRYEERYAHNPNRVAEAFKRSADEEAEARRTGNSPPKQSQPRPPPRPPRLPRSLPQQDPAAHAQQQRHQNGYTAVAGPSNPHITQPSSQANRKHQQPHDRQTSKPPQNQHKQHPNIGRPPLRTEVREVRLSTQTFESSRSGRISSLDLKRLLAKEGPMAGREDEFRKLMGMLDANRSSINVMEFEGLYRYIQDSHEMSTTSTFDQESPPSPIPSILSAFSSPKVGEPLAIAIVMEAHEEESEEEDSNCTFHMSSSSGPKGMTALQPLHHPMRPRSPLPPDTNSIFGAASELMAAVTSVRGKNMIIGPCTCRTCSVGCLVALLAMAAGRVEQLREDLAVEAFQREARVAAADGKRPRRKVKGAKSAPLVRLHEASSKLRDLVRTMAHIQLKDKECRIMQANGTQFVVALPHVQVDYLRPKKRIPAKKPPHNAPRDVDAPQDAEAGADAETEVPAASIPTTPPLNVRKNPGSPPRSDVGRRPPRIEVPDGVGTGDFLGSAWGNFSWGSRSSSIRSISSQSYRTRRVTGGNATPKFVDEAMRMGALQVVLEAASVEPFKLTHSRVESVPGAASKIVVERPEVPFIAASSATIETKGSPLHEATSLRPSSPPVPSRAASPLPIPSRAASPLPPRAVSRTASPLPSRATSPALTTPAPTTPPPRSPARLYSPQSRLSPLPPDRAPSPALSLRSVRSITPSIHDVMRSASPIPPPEPDLNFLADQAPELTRTAALRAANKVKAARDAQRSQDETGQLRRGLATAHAEIQILNDDRARLEATIAELRGRLAAAETMLDTYEDLAREVEQERRQLENDKFMLEMENARLEKKNAMLQMKNKI